MDSDISKFIKLYIEVRKLNSLFKHVIRDVIKRQKIVQLLNEKSSILNDYVDKYKDISNFLHKSRDIAIEVENFTTDYEALDEIERKVFFSKL